MARRVIDGDYSHDNLVADGNHIFHPLNPYARAQLRNVDQAAMAGEVDEGTVSREAHAPSEGLRANPR